MRFAVLGLYHEANTFSPVRADLDLFKSNGLFRRNEIVQEFSGSHATIGGFLTAAEQLSVELVPLTFGRINPIGAITEDAFESLAQDMLTQLAEEGPWDGVLLALHGAAVAEHIPDADAELAARVRGVVGPAVPLGAVLDMHANVSLRLIEALTVTLVYQTNPHVDAAEQGSQCARLLLRVARGEIQPVQTLVSVPLVANIAKQDTSEPPMAELVALAADVSSRPGMLSASVVEGFPYADVDHMGMSCIAIHDGDRAAATAAAQEVAAALWARRLDLQSDARGVAEALDIAKHATDGPVVLLDIGDNIGAGAPGDSTVILAAAQRHGIRSLLQTLWDPDAVHECVTAGVGASMCLTVGARHPHSAGRPVLVRGQVRRISNGRFEEPSPVHGGFRFFDMGTTAVLDTSDNHTLVLMSRQTANTSRHQYYCLGIDPAAYRVVIAKGVNAPRAAYRSIAAQLVPVDTDGIAAMNLARFEYQHRRRPLFPFEPDTQFLLEIPSRRQRP